MSVVAQAVAAALLALERAGYVVIARAPDAFRALCPRAALARHGDPIAIGEKQAWSSPVPKSTPARQDPGLGKQRFEPIDILRMQVQEPDRVFPGGSDFANQREPDHDGAHGV